MKFFTWFYLLVMASGCGAAGGKDERFFASTWKAGSPANDCPTAASDAEQSTQQAPSKTQAATAAPLPISSCLDSSQ